MRDIDISRERERERRDTEGDLKRSEKRGREIDLEIRKKEREIKRIKGDLERGREGGERERVWKNETSSTVRQTCRHRYKHTEEE